MEESSKRVICAATIKELSAVLPSHGDEELLQCSGELIVGDTLFAITGIGAVETVLSLSMLCQEHSITEIIQVGIAGAYPDSGLSIGEVVVVERDCFGDLGAESQKGFLSLSQMGLQDDQFYEADSELLLKYSHKAIKTVKGVTVHCCTGTEQTGLDRQNMWNGAIESMEGAACYMFAERFALPALQIRAISNRATTRDLSSWDIDGALTALGEVFQTYVA
ncbi:MAG: futalosine hydrolase [Fibrobacterales bacterium]